MTMIPRKRWWKAGDVALFAAGALFACPMVAKSADPSDETPAASSSLADAQRDKGEKGGDPYGAAPPAERIGAPAGRPAGASAYIVTRSNISRRTGPAEASWRRGLLAGS